MKFTHILVLALAVFFAACGGKGAEGKKDGQDSTKKDSAAAKTETPAAKSPKDLIAKKWKVDVESLKAVITEEMAKQKEKDPNAAKMAEAMMEPMMKAMGEMALEFLPDGTAKMVGGMAGAGKEESAKWSLNADNTILTIENKDGKKNEMKIEELTESKMVVSDPSGKQKMKLIFKPA